jgi:hypothetical protein
MSTFVQTGLNALSLRLAEIDILLEEAEKQFDENQDLYNAFCRSAQVLLISHFEGYTKDLIKNVLEDINYNSTFSASKNDLKRTFCLNFIPIDSNSGKANEKKILELIETFDSLNAKFKKEYFLYLDNKNPKASVIENITMRFGIKNFFKIINKSDLDLVFSNTNVDNIMLRDSLKNIIEIATSSYPFGQNDILKSTKEGNVEDFWKTFLDKILKNRYDIVHGNEILNASFYGHIMEDRIKVEILLYALTASICEQANPV